MIFQHAPAALRGRYFFLNFWHAGLYPEVITHVKFQVDWSKDLESTVPKIGRFSASHDRRPYNTVTHYTVIHCDMPFIAANELLNCFIILGAHHVTLHRGPQHCCYATVNRHNTKRHRRQTTCCAKGSTIWSAKNYTERRAISPTDAFCFGRYYSNSRVV